MGIALLEDCVCVIYKISPFPNGFDFPISLVWPGHFTSRLVNAIEWSPISLHEMALVGFYSLELLHHLRKSFSLQISDSSRRQQHSDESKLSPMSSQTHYTLPLWTVWCAYLDVRQSTYARFVSLWIWCLKRSMWPMSNVRCIIHNGIKCEHVIMSSTQSQRVVILCDFQIW